MNRGDGRDGSAPTLPTSVWLWLYALSGFLVKAIARSRKGLHLLQKHLNLEEHPLRSMGFVLMLLVTVVYVVWGRRWCFEIRGWAGFFQER